MKYVLYDSIGEKLRQTFCFCITFSAFNCEDRHHEYLCIANL